MVNEENGNILHIAKEVIQPKKNPSSNPSGMEEAEEEMRAGGARMCFVVLFVTVFSDGGCHVS